MSSSIGSDRGNRPIPAQQPPHIPPVSPRIRPEDETARRKADHGAKARAQDGGTAGEARGARSLAPLPEPGAKVAKTTKPSIRVNAGEVADAQADAGDERKEQRAQRRRENRAEERWSQEPLTDEDRQTIARFDRAERRAFRGLSRGDRAKFRKVYAYLYCYDRPGHETASSKSSRLAFRKALQYGKLTKEDRNGKSVLDHFADRMREDLAPGLESSKYGLDNRGQFQNLAEQIGEPAKMFQGVGTDDCVAASLAANMARRDPGEYMRIVSGLVFDGKATLIGPDGGKSTMTLDKRAVWKDRGRKVRNTTSDLIQQSFMTYARTKFPGGKGGGNGGLTMRQAEGLYENLTGEYAVALGVTDKNREEAAQTILAAGKAGSSFQVGFGNRRGDHMVTILGIGKDARGNSVVRFADSLTGEQRQMRWERFKGQIDGMILPSQFAASFMGDKTGSGDDHGGLGQPVDPGSVFGGAPVGSSAPASGGRRGGRGSPVVGG
ncbi:MAG: hypothetical protein FJZ00_08120 [Candidatus Sericytochromatia bacterium]|uniref:Uncharacterized protein n=1 Tax=Candidatus Tanganyikabacteria bacterium TaxID=2961651 RepID=A0A938BNG5_9BACT|nr:hypothetical protein [Candidatus Tanganyikabacteria bacterium]